MKIYKQDNYINQVKANIKKPLINGNEKDVTDKKIKKDLKEGKELILE